MTKRRITITLAAFACALGAAAVVRAGVPDGGGVIHGCYVKSAAPGSQPGTLRVIDTALGQTCTASEGTVNWSQTGPPGPQGPQGVQGPQGTRGPTGPQGSPGANAYFAGTGLGETGGNTFNILGSYQLPQGCSNGQSPFLLGTPLTHPWSCFTAANANESCASGKFQNGVDSSGDIKCATPPGNGSLTAEAQVTNGVFELPDGNGPVDLASVDVAAGTYLVFGKGEVQSEENVSGLGHVDCYLNDEGNDSVDFGKGELNTAYQIPFALTDLITTGAGSITLTCYATTGADGITVDVPTISVLKVG